jgi:hypothetical protein
MTRLLLVTPLLFHAAVLSAAPALRAPDLLPSSPAPVETASAANREALPPPALSSPAIGAPDAPAGAIALPTDQHPWARFAPGAWRTVRTISETFDPTGKLLGRTVTTRTQTLTEVTTETYTLQESSEVTVGGAQLPGPNQMVTLSLLLDQPLTQRATVKELAIAKVRIAGSDIPCRRWEVKWLAAQQPHRDIIWYAAGKSPFVLRRERSTTNASQPTTEVWRARRLELPLAIGDQLAAGWQQEIDITSPAGTTQRNGLCSFEAPGGLVAESSIERDPAGNRLRWTVTRLIDFGLSADDSMKAKAPPTADAGPGAEETPPRPRFRIFGRRSGE